MHYHIAREAEQLGQFSVEEIRAGLFDGKFLPTDLGWQEGQAEWLPLSQLFAGDVAGDRVRKVSPSQTPLAASLAPTYHSPTNGLAVTALILGIVSLFTCGLFGVGALVTIVLGHMALAKVRQSHGQLGGKGMAAAGLVMGYASLVLGVIAIFASLSMPVFSKIQEKGNITRSISNARQIITACKIYSADHEGKYPQALEELVQTGVIKKADLDNLLRCPLTKEYPGYEYYGAGKSDSDPGGTVIILGKAEIRGKRVVGLNDSSVAFGIPPSP